MWNCLTFQGREDRYASRSNIGWRSILIAIGLPLILGCGSKSELYPVIGKVYVEGKPAEGAIVVLHPTNEIETTVHRPSAQVQADGSFTLEAVPGEYQVAVVWYGDESQGNRVTGALPTKLSPRYGDPKTSTLKVDIVPHDNELPAFQLSR